MEAHPFDLAHIDLTVEVELEEKPSEEELVRVDLFEMGRLGGPVD